MPIIYSIWFVGLFACILTWCACELFRTRTLVKELRRKEQYEAELCRQLQATQNELKRLYQEQSQPTGRDALTGLLDHYTIMHRIEDELADSRLSREPFAIAVFDLDHFKQINDKIGHVAGDVILHDVGIRLRTHIRGTDFVARYSGEKFVLLLRCVDAERACEAVERLRNLVVTEPYFWQAESDGERFSITVDVTAGTALYPQDGKTSRRLLETAFCNLYENKKQKYAAQGSGDVSIVPVCPTPTLLIKHDAPATPTTEPLKQEKASKHEVLEVVGVQALTAAASARDQGTDEHAHRMVMLAEATARKLHLSEDEIHFIHLAALLHDIGKIGIPDSILHKPGPLSNEEWIIMRQHPEIGRQILTQLGGIFEYLSSIVVAHHERWDGTGYPNGLKGEEIPISARILSVIDSFDAITSRRSYKEARPIVEAREELLRCAGGQFDPRVVQAFLEVLDDHEHLFIQSEEGCAIVEADLVDTLHDQETAQI